MKYITYIKLAPTEKQTNSDKIILYHGMDKATAKALVREAKNCQCLLEGQIICVEYNGEIIYQYPNNISERNL